MGALPFRGGGTGSPGSYSLRGRDQRRYLVPHGRTRMLVQAYKSHLRMNSAVCLALLLLVVCGFPQPGRRSYVQSSAFGTYERDTLEASSVNLPKRRVARADDYMFEPSSFAIERFQECCIAHGFDEACAKFLCQWQNGRASNRCKNCPLAFYNLLYFNFSIKTRYFYIF